MHYYKHSIGDYRRDTMHLTLLEHGVYRQLLDLYYLNECELDANALRLVCARDADEIRAAESVLNEFFDKTETGYKHRRCDREIAEYHAKSEKAKASAEARWNGKSKASNAKAMRTHSEGNANHKPLTINHKPIIKGTRLPKDWEAPQEYIDFCTKQRPDLNANEVANSFKDYWISVAGAKGVKLDWFATWRNWVRNQNGNGSSKPMKGYGVISDDKFKEWLSSGEKTNERIA